MSVARSASTLRRLTRVSTLTCKFTVALSMVAAVLAPVASAHATAPAYPKLNVSEPSRGNPVTGIDGVSATGSVDPAGSDAPKTLALFVNGNSSDSRPCDVPAGTKTCTLSLLFDAGNLHGPQTIRVDFTTVNGTTISSTQTITAYTPPPVVHLTAPADHSSATVGDQVEVDTDGTTSLHSDWPRTMALLVDGVAVETDQCPSPSNDLTCSDAFTWDTSGLSPGGHTLQVKLTTYHDFAVSPLVHVTLTAPPQPTVVLTAPTAGTVTDLVFVSATGSVSAASGDSPYGMVLVIDGQEFGSTNLCPMPNALSCSRNLIWDTTGLSGQHTVAVEFLTADGQVTSSAVTVTVSHPPPTVSITSPLADAAVTGITPVTATGTLDDRQSDSVKDMQLLVDGSPSGPVIGCGVVSRTACTTTFSWDTAGLSGAHRLQVRFDTRLTSVTSAAILVNAPVVQPQPVPTTISLQLPPGPFARGSWGFVRGRVTNATSHAALSGVPVHVVFTPLKGAPSSVDVTSAADGSFVATDPQRLLVATTALATTGPDFGSSSATDTLTVKVWISCHALKRVQHGVPATVVCTAPGLSFGSVLALHYAQDGHGVLYAKIVKGAARFTLTVGAKGWVKVWATTATTHSYVASASRAYWLAVH